MSIRKGNYIIAGRFGNATWGEISGDITSQNDLKSKLDKKCEALAFKDVTANTWVSDTTYEGFSYRCDLDCPGVTEDMVPYVMFTLDDSTSGNYAPICNPGQDKISIYSVNNNYTVIPSVVAFTATKAN